MSFCIAGYLYDLSLDYYLSFYVAGACGCLAGLVTLLAIPIHNKNKRKKRKTRGPTQKQPGTDGGEEDVQQLRRLTEALSSQPPRERSLTKSDVFLPTITEVLTASGSLTQLT